MGAEEDIRLLMATPSDAAAISVLHARLFERAWDEDGVRRLLEHPACMALVALERGQSKMVGFVLAQLTADEAEILSLGVVAAWQRRGVARMLVEGVIETARRKDVRRLFLDVSERNAAALALYRRLWFTQMGRRKEYYVRADGEREDALLMVRKLGGDQSSGCKVT